MTRLIGRLLVVAVAVGSATAGCAPALRVVPVPSVGAVVDPVTGSARAGAEGVELVVRGSAWTGSPSYLTDYVTPFHVSLANGSSVPLAYDYVDVRLFDEARFQYTALSPAEVRQLYWSSDAGRLAVSAGVGVGIGVRHHWRRGPYFRDPWLWGPLFFPYYPYAYPYPYPYPYWGPPPTDDVALRALPMGPLQPGARTAGFVYFPRLRPEARRLSLEFHYRLGTAERVLTLSFVVERATRDGAPAVRAAHGSTGS